MTLDSRDKILELVSLVLLCLNALLIVFGLNDLPEVIPIHFNGEAEANDWGSKYHLWLPFCFSGFMYGLMTFFSMKPMIFKFRMQGKNIPEEARLTAKMSRAVKAGLCGFFLALTYFMIETAQGRLQKQIPLLFLVAWVLIISPCLYYAVKINNLK